NLGVAALDSLLTPGPTHPVALAEAPVQRAFQVPTVVAARQPPARHTRINPGRLIDCIAADHHKKGRWRLIAVADIAPMHIKIKVRCHGPAHTHTEARSRHAPIKRRSR